MSNLNITSEQFQTAQQSVQTRLVRIELLNYQFQTVDSLEGICTGGNFTIDANSDIRRTGSITLVVNDSTFDVQPGGKIWLDKFLKVWVGTFSLLTGKTSWTNLGVYIIDAPNYQYDAANNTLTLSLLDLMAKMTGVRNGYTKGVPISFPAGEKIRDALIAVLRYAGFNNYIVQDPPKPGLIPYDLEFGQGATIYELLKTLVDLYPGYEMFFDVNGTFIYQKIPNGDNEQVVVDDSLWSSVVLNEGVSTDLQNVKNSIEVYGKTHDPAFFSTSTTVFNSTIKLTIEGVSSYTDGMIYGFTLKDNPGYRNMQLQINDLSPLPLMIDNDKFAEIHPEQGEVYYCVQYNTNNWNWLGHLQAYGIAEDANPDSPFYIESTVGKIQLPLFGEIYDNIYSDDLAQQRAEYELYLHANMNDTLSLTTVPVYWMDVNLLVEYKTKRNKKKKGENLFLTKVVNFGLSPTDTMTISLMRYYPNATV